jgi:hypothetical protein
MTFVERAHIESARAEAAYFADGGAEAIERRMARQAGHLQASMLILAIDADIELEALRREIAELRAGKDRP